ncbi:glycoside hydrolase family 108 protein [Sphingomonas sp. CJ99]
MDQHPDIVVNAFSPRYLRAFNRVIRIEGGYVNHPADRGGETKNGVSLRFLVAEGKVDKDFDGVWDFDLDMDGDIDGADIRALTVTDAKWLFQSCFWLRLDCESFAAPIGEMMFDQGVNGGLMAARRLLQRAVNICLFKPQAGAPDRPAMLEQDADIGPLTRDALDWVIKRPGLGMPAMIAAYREAAADRYRGIVAVNPSQSVFLKGWLRRAAELGA